MNDMRLISLRLKNWKQFKDYTFAPTGNDAQIYAQNGIGKTVGHYDPFLWLMLGVDSKNRADYKIKTEDANGDPIHFLDHSVEAVLEIDGATLTLKKVYKEKWTKPRGQVEQEFGGHETQHYVDEVPVSQREYNDVIGRICDRETFKLLTNPYHFTTELKMDVRRKMLFDTFGDMTDEEIIASTEELARLDDVLDGKSLEDRKKTILESRKNTSKRLMDIPAEIRGAESVLPDVNGLDHDKLTGERMRLGAQRTNLQEEKVRVESGGEVAKKQKELAEIGTRLIEIKNSQGETDSDTLEVKRKELAEINKKLGELQGEIDTATTSNKTDGARVEALEKEIEPLRAEVVALAGETFDCPEYVESVDEVCPTCEQSIPLVKVEETRAKALANYNLERSEAAEKWQTKHDTDLKAKKDSGIAKKKEVEELRNTISLRLANIAKNEAVIQDIHDGEAKRLTDEIEALTNQDTPIEDNADYKAALKDQADLNDAIATLKQGNQGAVAKIELDIESLDGQIEELDADLGKFKLRKEGEETIETVKGEEKELAKTYEQLEADLFLIDLFTKTKVTLLTDKINGKFKLARFKLFEDQVNGGVKDICEVTHLWDPPSAGQTVNVGLDIMSTFSKELGIIPPVFVDNAESVTKLIDMPGQVIQLIHSPKDKKLRTEISEPVKLKEVV